MVKDTPARLVYNFDEYGFQPGKGKSRKVISSKGTPNFAESEKGKNITAIKYIAADSWVIDLFFIFKGDGIFMESWFANKEAVAEEKGLQRQWKKVHDKKPPPASIQENKVSNELLKAAEENSEVFFLDSQAIPSNIENWQLRCGWKLRCGSPTAGSGVGGLEVTDTSPPPHSRLCAC
ncbi:uncharacterized protein ANIA_08840 [Aspergillus nidulans FGSC A4]|uniref:DDE-1 domain-containing protein n=1 Tax=Emericella nidulans (strain FGSC A4 / ATCC 38163 / CBS 112.46 / NRRL 194 / M139) TaxID=227321 RepID=C8V9J1_EMENI|nr:hypothetical protein [Aspergillus nidulans FGSC A4]CBF77907.1 TPA: conserved hypothetical protein [Aspergillus nidulans FGSC A4]